MTDTTRSSFSIPNPLELRDGDLVVGAIDGDVVQFRGFASAVAASQAAAVAHQAMTRRLARGRRGTPSASESDLSSIRRSSDRANVAASGRPVASVLRSFVEDLRNDEGGDFAFEIRVPPPIDELRMRSMGYVMYRALRSSGVHWPLVRPAAAPAPVRAEAAIAAASEKTPRKRAVAALWGIRRWIEHVTTGWTLPWPRPQGAA